MRHDDSSYFLVQRPGRRPACIELGLGWLGLTASSTGGARRGLKAFRLFRSDLVPCSLFLAAEVVLSRVDSERMNGHKQTNKIEVCFSRPGQGLIVVPWIEDYRRWIYYVASVGCVIPFF